MALKGSNGSCPAGASQNLRGAAGRSYLTARLLRAVPGFCGPGHLHLPAAVPAAEEQASIELLMFPFFPEILLSTKPPETQGKGPVFEKESTPR